MFWKRTLPIILIGVLMVMNFMIYPSLASQKRQETAASQSAPAEDAPEQAAGEKKDGLEITWQTVVLTLIAVFAGVLRFRNGKRTREQAWDAYIAQQEGQGQS